MPAHRAPAVRHVSTGPRRSASQDPAGSTTAPPPRSVRTAPARGDTVPGRRERLAGAHLETGAVWPDAPGACPEEAWARAAQRARVRPRGGSSAGRGRDLLTRSPRADVEATGRRAARSPQPTLAGRQ